jgi:hypothetical protein
MYGMLLQSQWLFVVSSCAVLMVPELLTLQIFDLKDSGTAVLDARPHIF